MSTTIAFLLFLVIFSVLGLLLPFLQLAKPAKTSLPYILKDSLFSPTEKSFIGCLDSIVSTDIRVFAKVRIADLFDVGKTADRSEWQSAFNKINSKHVDFVLCRATDLSPLAAIELDDKSHDRADRQQRDIFSQCAICCFQFTSHQVQSPEHLPNGRYR